jgi:hypothetical protein
MAVVLQSFLIDLVCQATDCVSYKLLSWAYTLAPSGNLARIDPQYHLDFVAGDQMA